MKWDFLQNRIKGEVLDKGMQNFVSFRDSMVWNNLKPDRIPDAIVKVRDEEDIIETIRFAKENQLKVVVHGGGHSWCGLAVRNGGITIDLSSLTDVKIDPISRIAMIQPVVSNRDLARKLGKHNLAFPIGHCPTVKASGYLLSGGMSWNMSEWGPGCLSVEAIDFVTADGKMVKASEEDYPDLFWAARGAGPGMFAVATRFYLKCYPLPKTMMLSNYYYHLDDLKEVVEEVVSLGWTMPKFIELSIFLMKAPEELQSTCKKTNGKICLVNAVAFTSTKEEGEAALAILEKGKVIKKCLKKSINEPTNFDHLADLSKEAWPENHRNLCENLCSQRNPVDILLALKDKMIDAPSEKSVIVFCQSTGQHSLLESSADMALSLEGRSYGGVWSIWEKKEDDIKNFKWHKECTDILKPFTQHHYIGETNIVEDPSRTQNAYNKNKWNRLQGIRKKYDPNGLFFGFLDGIS